jgi:hypothetical protein
MRMGCEEGEMRRREERSGKVESGEEGRVIWGYEGRFAE